MAFTWGRPLPKYFLLSLASLPRIYYLGSIGETARVRTAGSRVGRGPRLGVRWSDYCLVSGLRTVNGFYSCSLTVFTSSHVLKSERGWVHMLDQSGLPVATADARPANARPELDVGWCAVVIPYRLLRCVTLEVRVSGRGCDK
jgi:hypothetical protein